MNQTSPAIAVILGARVKPDGSASPSLARRVAHGIELYRQGRVSKLLFSGGLVRHAPAEALVMRELARDADLPDEALLVEQRSRNTLENAFFCRVLLSDLPGGADQPILLVSDGYHLPRALYTFRRLGMNPQGSAPTAPMTLTRAAAMLREAAALGLYLWRVERAVRGF